MLDVKILKGIMWSGFEKFSVQIFQFIISIILARLLSPKDFGVIAIVLVLMNIIQVFNEGGFAEALMKKLDRDNLDYSTVFYFNILFSIILYIILYVSAPYIANYFNLLQLINLLRLLGINIIITSFVVVQRTILTINVDFKTQAKASFIGIIIGGIIGIYCANKNLEAFSIVAQYLSSNLVTTIFIWIFSSWKPSFQFSFSRLKILFDYAYKLILARFVNVLFSEIYSIAIGKYYSPIQLGYFNRAKSFIGISSNNITSIVQRVSTPVLCKFQNDNKMMGEMLIKFIQKTSMLVFPLLFGLFVLSESFVYVILGPKWLSTAWILQSLCPVGILYVFSTFNMNIFNATGKTNLALQSELIKKVINIIIITAISINFKFLILSQILVALIEFFINTWYTKKQIDLNWKKQVKSVFPIIISSLIMCFVVYLTTVKLESNIIKLFTGIFIGFISYSILCYIFNISQSKIFINKYIKRLVNN